MKTHVMKLLGLTLCLVLFAVFGIGCSSTPRMGIYQVNVKTDSSLKGTGASMPRVEVDIVGLNESQMKQWREYKIEDYFSGTDQLRSNSREYTKSLVFTDDKSVTKTLEKNDPLWAIWDKRGVRSMMILVNSKGLRTSGGALVERKLELPLTTDQWKGDVIDLVVKSSGVESQTGQKGSK